MAWSELGLLGPYTQDLFAVSDAATDHSTGSERIIYHSAVGDSQVYASEYPGLADRNGGGGFVYAVGASDQIWGLTLDDSGFLWLVVEEAGTATDAALWKFDTANAADTGTKVSTWTEAWRGHITYNPVDGDLYVADGFGAVGDNVDDPYTYLWSVDPSTGTRTAVATYGLSSGVVVRRNSIAATPDGAVWFQTDDGIVRYSGSASAPFAAGIPGTNVGDLLAQSDDTVIFTDTDDLAYKLDSSFTQTAFPDADQTVNGRPYIGWNGAATWGHDLVLADGYVMELDLTPTATPVVSVGFIGA